MRVTGFHATLYSDFKHVCLDQQEVTVKGLEPDIQKLIAKHKAEVKKLKSTHQVK